MPLWPEKSSPSGQVVFVEISVKSREIRLLEAIQQCCVKVEKPPFCIHLGAKMGDIPSINSDVRKRPWQSIRLRLSLVISFLESGFADCHSRPRRFNVNLSWRQGVLPISWYGIVLNSLICFLFFLKRFLGLFWCDELHKTSGVAHENAADGPRWPDLGGWERHGWRNLLRRFFLRSVGRPPLWHVRTEFWLFQIKLRGYWHSATILPVCLLVSDRFASWSSSSDRR